MPSILEEAIKLTGGDRRDAYGSPLADFKRVSGAARAMGLDYSSPLHQPLIMILVKMSRLMNTPTHHDSVVDIAGYARTYELAVEDMNADSKDS